VNDNFLSESTHGRVNASEFYIRFFALPGARNLVLYMALQKSTIF